MRLGESWVTALRKSSQKSDQLQKRLTDEAVIETTAAKYFHSLRSKLEHELIEGAAERGSDCIGEPIELSFLGSRAFDEFRSWASVEELNVGVGKSATDNGSWEIFLTIAPAVGF